MDWSKTKTIFIITFLILDCFLGYQFMEKRNSSQLDVLLEATIEDQLKANGITYVQLPKEITKAVYERRSEKIVGTKSNDTEWQRAKRNIRASDIAQF